jgi:hypothetical protein
LAAVSESEGELDAAKNALDQAHGLAMKHGFVEHAARTQARIDALPSRATPVALYRKAELPEIPALKPPEPPPLSELEPPDETVVGPEPEGDAGEGEPGEGGAGETETGDDAGGGADGGGDGASDDGGR